MASEEVPSGRASPAWFPQARLCIIKSNEQNRRKVQCDVRLAFSHRIYWNELNNLKDADSLTLKHFSRHRSLELVRLDDTKTWKDVEKKAAPSDTDSLSLVVCGRLHDRKPWTPAQGEVKVVLTANSTEQRNRWLNEIRHRICSAKALHEHAKKLVERNGCDSTVEELARQLKVLSVNSAEARNDEPTEGNTQVVSQERAPLSSSHNTGMHHATTSASRRPHGSRNSIQISRRGRRMWRTL